MQAMKMCCTHNIFSYFILFIGPITNKKKSKSPIEEDNIWARLSHANS